MSKFRTLGSQIRLSGIFALFCQITLGVAFTPPEARAEQDKYRFDVWHSNILFTWNHGGVSELSGKFPKFQGEFLFDEKDVTKSAVKVTIKADAISTGIQAFDGSLTSDAFFDAKSYPEITYVSTEIRRTGVSTATVIGDLTILGITKSVPMNVELIHQGEHPLKWYNVTYKGEWLGFKGETAISRSDFGLTRWAPAISDRVVIRIHAALKKIKKRKKKKKKDESSGD